MSQPEPDSPFSEFAAPKTSAVEAWRRERKQSGQEQQIRWLFYATMLFAAGAGAGVAAGCQGGVPFFVVGPLAGFAGAVAGAPCGLLLGALSWALMASRRRVWNLGLHAEVTHGNKWSMLVVWMTAWFFIAVVSGAALGASAGVGQILEVKDTDGLVVGNLVGAAAAVGAVTLAMLARQRRRPAEDAGPTNPFDPKMDE